MTINNNDESIVIYQNNRGNISVNVKLTQETLWLSLNQIAELFERDKSVISKHLRNIFKEEELEKNTTVAKFATVQVEGGHKVERIIEYFNLDAIISVGYRINSKRGTEFRRWASQVLKDYLVQGYSINQEQLNNTQIKQLQQTIDLLSTTLVEQNLVNDIGANIISIIRKYTRTWDILLRYDENRIVNKKKYEKELVELTYDEAIQMISALKRELISKKEASSLFGQERVTALHSILCNIVQTFDSEPLYHSNISRAAHLLYFVIKDHPFSDGNKRIGCLLFLMYLEKAGIISNIDNNGMIALALLIAESNPSQKDIMVKLIINILQEHNNL